MTWGASAQQEPQGTVVIVRVPKDAAVIARIRAELEANDWRVRELGPDSNSARAPLAGLVTAAGARAALRMQPERPAIELWVANEGGDAAGGGEVVALPSDEVDDALLALRTTEALRARGLRLPKRVEAATTSVGTGVATGAAVAAAGTATAAPGGTPSSGASEEARKAAEAAAARATAETRAREQAERERAEKEQQEKQRAEQARLEKERAEQEAAQTEEDEEADEEDTAEAKATSSSSTGTSGDSLLYIELGPALAASVGGIKPNWGLWANVRLQPSALWSFSALGFVPFAGGNYELNYGNGRVRTAVAGLSADLHGVYEALELSAGAGAAVVLGNYAFTPTSAGMLQDVPLLHTWAGLARVGVQYALSPLFRIGARGVFGLAAPPLRVCREKTADGGCVPVEPTKTWGQPFVLATIALELALPEPTR